MKALPILLTAFGMMLQCAAVPALASSAPVALNMPEQSLRDALNGLARQTGLQVIYTANDVGASMRAPRIEGTYTPEAALELLLKNSGLNYEFLNPRTVAVSLATPAKAVVESSASNVWRDSNTDDAANNGAQSSRLTLVQAAAQQSSSSQDQTGISLRNSRNTASVTEDGTMVVTGSHIRGAQSSASPVMVFDREEIQRAGFSNTQQFIQSLPQNFRGGYNETGILGVLGGEGANLNYVGGSGANLRGLGSDATLTLLNGRRVAPTSVGEAVDLSMIPLAAIQRIDVLTDGASAIYGSDAVSGVINIVLRKEYNGAETNLRYGDVTDGSHGEIKASQTFGHTWSSGSVLASYEYTDRKSLSIEERAYLAGASLPGVELVPENRQNSVVLALSQSLSPRVSLSGQAIYSSRESVATYFSGANISSPMEAEQISAGTSLAIDVGRGWQVDVGAGYSSSDNTSLQFEDGVEGPSILMKSDVMTLDAKADGAIFGLPGGSALLAVGGQYRADTFNSTGSSSNTRGEDKRHVSAVFSELLLPFVGAGNRRSGIERLEMTLAARYEDYSDVGSSADPKFGLLWSPIGGLSLRGTYGTSFRAPTAYEASTRALPLQPLVYTMPDPLPGQPNRQVPVIVLYGNTGLLEPEEATNWTVGLDLRPESLPGFSASLTYFDIQFENRVAEPLAVNTAFFNALIEEAQHPTIITRNPDIAVVNAYYANPKFIDLIGGVAPADIVAIVDNQRTNVAATVQKGLDFDFTYDLAGDAGDWTFKLGGSYLVEKKNRLTPDSPLLNSLNTLFNPVDLRLRNSVGWNRNNFGITVFHNFTDSYRDVRPGFEAKIDSWNTFDMTLRYDFKERSGLLNGTTVSFAAQNFTDEDPPAINYFGFNYDGTNANPIGRYLSLNVIKQW